MNNEYSVDLDEATEAHRNPAESELFERYSAILTRLRAPDGCPWDRKQTLHSLRRYVVEEAFELVAAIDDATNAPDDASATAAVADELGDLLLIVLLAANALADSGGPNLSTVLARSGHKLIRRHPHVFAALQVDGIAGVEANWERIKTDIERRSVAPDATPPGLPPLTRAIEIQRRFAKLGFDWPNHDGAITKLDEELAELRAALSDHETAGGSRSAVESELGDLLFSAVNVARKLDLDPNVCLAATTTTFLRRTQRVTELARGRSLHDMQQAELDELWRRAKGALSTDSDGDTPP